jgi:DNA-binding transcriptional MerR regulator
MSETWTIGELAERATDVLRARPQLNGRVRDVPNERLIRWYTTIGLLDPPLARRGRIAIYGRRHLMQLVAVKRRQAAGRSIAEIQTELTGATDASLAAIAQLPAAQLPAAGEPLAAAEPLAGPEPSGGTGSAEASPVVVRGARDRFWAQRPAAELVHADRVDLDRVDLDPVDLDPVKVGGAGSGQDGVAHSGLMHGVRLAPEVTLLFAAAGRAPSEDDLGALAAAARPLLDTLLERGLLERPTHDRSPGNLATSDATVPEGREGRTSPGHGRARAPESS